MKRIFWAGCLFLGVTALSIAGPNPVVRVNGKVVNFNGERPRTMVGRMMVPMRAIFEAIGAYVEYNEVLHRVNAKRENESIELRAGSRVAQRNGIEIELDVAPISSRGRMMVPLRFIAESLGADVSYSKETNTVDIITNGEIPGVKPPPPLARSSR